MVHALNDNTYNYAGYYADHPEGRVGGTWNGDEFVPADWQYKQGGGIRINPANKGKFNATKRRTGKTTEELTHSKNPVTRRRAIFAQNAAHWNHKHQIGGLEDTVFGRYNREKQAYFDTMPIVNEQYGIGRLDLPEVVVTAPDPNKWWTPSMEKPEYPASGALAQDWITHAAELAPALLVATRGRFPGMYSNMLGMMARHPAAANLAKNVIASEIGGRGVDLLSNAVTGNTWGQNVGNVVESVTGWNPNGTIIGELLTEATNPGYAFSPSSAWKTYNRVKKTFDRAKQGGLNLFSMLRNNGYATVSGNEITWHPLISRPGMGKSSLQLYFNDDGANVASIGSARKGEGRKLYDAAIKYA